MFEERWRAGRYPFQRHARPTHCRSRYGLAETDPDFWMRFSSRTIFQGTPIQYAPAACALDFMGGQADAKDKRKAAGDLQGKESRTLVKPGFLGPWRGSRVGYRRPCGPGDKTQKTSIVARPEAIRARERPLMMRPVFRAVSVWARLWDTGDTRCSSAGVGDHHVSPVFSPSAHVLP